MESKTPICDDSKYEADQGAEVVPLYVAMGLEYKLREMELEIGKSNAKRLRFEKELAEAQELIKTLQNNCGQCQKLAEARAEIEHLKAEIRDNNHLAARQIVPAEMAVDDLRVEIERKDKLIESLLAIPNKILKTDDNKSLKALRTDNPELYLEYKIIEAKEVPEELQTSLNGVRAELTRAISKRDDAEFEVCKKDKLIEQMREALSIIDAIGDEKGSPSGNDALRCFSIAKAALEAAEGGE